MVSTNAWAKKLPDEKCSCIQTVLKVSLLDTTLQSCPAKVHSNFDNFVLYKITGGVNEEG